MLSAGMSVSELAHRSGTSEPQVRDYLRNVRVPTLPVLFRLATALQVTLADFKDVRLEKDGRSERRQAVAT
jgi:transcriptional regulator with XRE-family HTH domain